MNSHADTPAIVIADHDATNRKLLARKAAAKTDHIESASRKVAITLCSPEGERLYLRCFEVTQINFHYITMFARMANLMSMHAFAEAWPDAEIVQQAVGQLPWGHNLMLLTKLKDKQLRLAYAQRAIAHG